MVDFLDEVKEDLRRERNEQLWNKYSPVLLSLACLVVLGVGGFKFYQTQQLKATQEVAATYDKALALLNSNALNEAKSEEAMALLKPLTTQDSPYKNLAQFAMASEMGKTNPQASVKAFDVLASDSTLDKTMRDDAAVRAGYLLVDTASYEEIKTRLTPLTQANSPFRLAAKELIGLAAFKAKDIKTVQDIFNELKIDAQATNSLRLRSEVMLAVSTGQK
jgi:hypothetical protein